MGHHEEEKNRLAVLDKTIETICLEAERAKGHRLADYRAVYNASLYLLLFDRDFAILRSQMKTAESGWERRFVARQMAVALAEACEDLPKLIGRKFRPILTRLELPPEGLAAFGSAMQTFYAFARDNESSLRTMRNGLGAHRELDAVQHLAAIKAVEPHAVYEKAVEFYGAVRVLIPALIGIVEHMGRTRTVLRQLLSRGPEQPER